MTQERRMLSITLTRSKKNTSVGENTLIPLSVLLLHFKGLLNSHIKVCRAALIYESTCP